MYSRVSLRYVHMCNFMNSTLYLQAFGTCSIPEWARATALRSACCHALRRLWHDQCSSGLTQPIRQESQAELRDALSDSARLRRKDQSAAKQLSVEIKHLTAELTRESEHFERANYLHREALARLEVTLQECGKIVQQFRREVVLLRTNVARAVGVAFRRSHF